MLKHTTVASLRIRGDSSGVLNGIPETFGAPAVAAFALEICAELLVLANDGLCGGSIPYAVSDQQLK